MKQKTYRYNKSQKKQPTELNTKNPQGQYTRKPRTEDKQKRTTKRPRTRQYQHL